MKDRVIFSSCSKVTTSVRQSLFKIQLLRTKTMQRGAEKINAMNRIMRLFRGEAVHTMKFNDVPIVDLFSKCTFVHTNVLISSINCAGGCSLRFQDCRNEIRRSNHSNRLPFRDSKEHM